MSGGPSHGVPGHVKTILPVPMPHPRDVTATDFNDLKRELLTAIHSEAAETRYLVVANQTASSPELVQHLTELANDNPKATFTLLIPATHLSELLVRPAGLPQAIAQENADKARALFQQAGLNVDGVVIGDQTPTRAIYHELKARRGVYDEIILCTLPAGASKWMARGQHKEVQRKFDIPVTHLVAASILS
jgi:hypothetical protein